ncbi:hypothetical protein ABES02_29850, partial [Neobacillus pocheonensis]|uniref:hypothetical protein n=1 Tax=Neobacillus pocheonensis TaxID=363869 RepID=UPI003D2D0777
GLSGGRFDSHLLFEDTFDNMTPRNSSKKKSFGYNKEPNGSAAEMNLMKKRKTCLGDLYGSIGLPDIFLNI